jgi:hypothetical protein
VGYEIGTDFILVEFKNGVKYLYSYRSAGVVVVEIMKLLAKENNWLSTYIAKNRPEFENKN